MYKNKNVEWMSNEFSMKQHVFLFLYLSQPAYDFYLSWKPAMSLIEKVLKYIWDLEKPMIKFLHELEKA